MEGAVMIKDIGREVIQEKIQEKIQSICKSLMRLVEETKESRGKIAMLEAEVEKLEAEVEKLKAEVEKLKAEVEKLKEECKDLTTNSFISLTGEVVKKVEMKIVDLLGGDGTVCEYVTLKHVVNNFSNPARLVEEEVFHSEDEVKEANRRWQELKEKYELNFYHLAVMKCLGVQRSREAHPEISTVEAIKVIQSTRDRKTQEVLDKLVPIIQDHGI